MSDEFCKDGEKLFDSLTTMSKDNNKTTQDIMYAKTLYENAKFYYGTNELNGALVSFSCCAVLLNSIMSHLGLNETSAPTPTTSSAEDNTSIKEGANRLLNCCLNAVQELQGRVKKNSGSNSKDEEKKDWEKICTNLNPLVFKEGGGDCLFFSDVAGMLKEKDILKSSLIYPLTYPNLYPKTAKGILLYGPPGTGKTFIVKAAVNELQKTDPNIAVLFFAPSPGDLKGKYVGETEKKIEEWFTCASKAACDAQLNCPKKKQYISILFMDEFDAIGPDRSQDNTGFASNSVNTILQMMDGVASKKNVTVVAATNFPWSLDSAILRRFDTQILVNLPTEQDIEEVINIEIRKVIQLRNVENIDAYCNNEIQVYQKGKEKKSADNCNNNTCIENIKEDLTTKAPYNAMVYDYYDNNNKSFFIGLRAELKSKNFSNSDISRLMKYASTYTGKMAISNNLFYSTDLIRDLQRENSLYISSLTRMRDSNEGIKVAVDSLNFYLNGGKDGSLPNGIIEINRPDIVKVNHDNKVFINSKCLFYKNNDLIINDSKIKDIYFHIDIKGEKIEIDEYKKFLKKIESNIDSTNVDTIITFNINIKEKVNKNKNEQVFLFPISTKILSIVLKPLYEIYAEVLQNILKLEMLDASDKEIENKLKELEFKRKEYENIKKGLFSTTKNSIMDYLKSITIDNIYNLLKDKLQDNNNTNNNTNNTGGSNNNDVAKKYAETVFSVSDINYDLFINNIKTSTLFNINYNNNDFFSYGLKKILTNYGSFSTLTNKINILAKKDGENALLKNFYDFYTYLLLYKCAEKYKDDTTPNFITEFLDKTKFDTVKLNYLMDIYLSSLNEYDKKISLFKTDIDMPELILRSTLINENILQLSNLLKLISKSTDLNTQQNITLIKSIIEKYKQISKYIYENFYKKELTNDDELNYSDDNEIVTQEYLRKLKNNYEKLPKFYTIDTKIYKHSSEQIPLYLIQYSEKEKNEEILININQYIDYTSNFNKINNTFNLFKIDNLQKFYLKIDFDFFTEIFKKNIDIRSLKTTYNDQFGRNKKNLNSIFDLSENFNTVEQQLIQLYINDVFQFCKTLDRIDLTQLDDTGEEESVDKEDVVTEPPVNKEELQTEITELGTEISQLTTEIAKFTTEYDAKKTETQEIEAAKEALKSSMNTKKEDYIRALNSIDISKIKNNKSNSFNTLKANVESLNTTYTSNPTAVNFNSLTNKLNNLKQLLDINLEEIDKKQYSELYTAFDTPRKEYNEKNKAFDLKTQETSEKETALIGEKDKLKRKEDELKVKNEKLVKLNSAPPETKSEIAAKAKKNKLDTLKETIIGLYLNKLAKVCVPNDTIERNSLSSDVLQKILGLVCKRLNDNYDFVRYKKLCILGQYLNTSNNTFKPIKYKDFIDTQIQDSGALINAVKRVNGNPVFLNQKSKLSETATTASNVANTIRKQDQQPPNAMVDLVLAEFNKVLSFNEPVDQTVLGKGGNDGTQSSESKQIKNGGKNTTLKRGVKSATSYSFSKNKSLKNNRLQKGGVDPPEEKAVAEEQKAMNFSSAVKTNPAPLKSALAKPALSKSALSKPAPTTDVNTASNSATSDATALKSDLKSTTDVNTILKNNTASNAATTVATTTVSNTIANSNVDVSPQVKVSNQSTYIPGYDNEFIDLFIKNETNLCEPLSEKIDPTIKSIEDYMTTNKIKWLKFTNDLNKEKDDIDNKIYEATKKENDALLNPSNNVPKEDDNIITSLNDKLNFINKLYNIIECMLNKNENMRTEMTNMIINITSNIENQNFENAKNDYVKLSKIMLSKIYENNGTTNKVIYDNNVEVAEKFEELNKKIIDDLKIFNSNQTFLSENIKKMTDLKEKNFFQKWWTFAGTTVTGSKDKWYNDMIEAYTTLQKKPEIPTTTTNAQKLNFIKQEVELRINLANLVFINTNNFVQVQPLYEDAYNIAITEILNFPTINDPGNNNIIDIQFFYNAILEVGVFYKKWAEFKLTKKQNYESRKLAKQSYLYMEQQFMYLFKFYNNLGQLFNINDYEAELEGFVSAIKNHDMFETIIKSIYYLADSYFFYGSNKEKFKINDSEDYDIFIIKANILMKLCEEMLNTSNVEDERNADPTGAVSSLKQKFNLGGGALEDVNEKILNDFKAKILPLIKESYNYNFINLQSIKTHIDRTTNVNLDEIKKNEYDNTIATEYRDIIINQTSMDTTILNMEQYGFLEFCTSKEGNLITGIKKVVSKTIFIRTIFSLSQFKEMAQYGTIWKCAKSHIQYVGDTIKKHVFNANNNTLTADQKYMARAFLDQLENKNLLTSLFINNVIAVGFLIDPINKSIIDDKIIFDIGNKMAIIRWIDISTSGWNAYAALSKSFGYIQGGVAGLGMGYGIFKLFQGAIWTLQNVPGYSYISEFMSGVSKYFSGTGAIAVTVENVASADFIQTAIETGAGNGAGTAIVDNPTATPQPTAAPDWAKNIGEATAGTSTAGDANEIAMYIAIAVGACLAIALVWKEIQGWNKDLKSSQEIISNIISKQIYHIIIVKGFLDVDSFDIDPAEAFITELNNLINTVITIIDGIEKQESKSKGKVLMEKTGNFFTYNPSEATLKDINTDFFATLLQKSKDMEIDKKLLTNLNIPVKAFANALLNVKSTDVAETRKKLQTYYDDKDKMLADLKKEKTKGSA